MNDVLIKALIVDSDGPGARALADALREIEVVLSVDIRNTVPDDFDSMKSLDINAIYIDPIGLEIDGTSDFIFRIRNEHPSVVFVLYYDVGSLKAQENLFTQVNAKGFVITILSKGTPMPTDGCIPAGLSQVQPRAAGSHNHCLA